MVRVCASRKPAFSYVSSRTPGEPWLKGPGWPGSGGGSWARRRMIETGTEKNVLFSGVEVNLDYWAQISEEERDPHSSPFLIGGVTLTG